ncbi:MAG: GMC family oxidoreductase [Rhodococcus fascians]
MSRRADSIGDEPVVVIGTGPCGAVAAHQLVRRGIPVVSLDSGSSAPRGLIVRAAGNTLYRRKDWSRYQSDRVAPSAGPEVAWYSSLTLGGLSNYWTAAIPRFAPEDFTDGARLDERFAWPIGYDDLEPYYRLAEGHLTPTVGESILGVPESQARYHHRLPDDWMSVAATARQHGHGLGAIPMAKGSPWMVARRGTEFGSYQCVIEPILGDRCFELRRNAHATTIRWSSSAGRVDAVEYIDRATGELRVIPARAVVVAAGTVDTTLLLLRSTSGDFPSGLGNSSGLVGRYLHDHPREWWTADLGRPMRALSHPVYVAREEHSASPPLTGTSHTIGLARPADRLRSYVRGRTRQVGVQVFGTMVPDPDFGVALGPESIDPAHQLATITLHYDQQAVDNITSSRERLREVLRSGGLNVEIPGPFHDLLPGSSVHFAGTVRMHNDPRHGVLDAWNRMHDAPEVIVCDMSAFTTGPEKNPTLTAMAIALRAADRLADDIAGAKTRAVRA